MHLIYFDGVENEPPAFVFGIGLHGVECILVADLLYAYRERVFKDDGIGVNESFLRTSNALEYAHQQYQGQEA
jgi:hypothetical protein